MILVAPASNSDRIEVGTTTKNGGAHNAPEIFPRSNDGTVTPSGILL